MEGRGGGIARLLLGGRWWSEIGGWFGRGVCVGCQYDAGEWRGWGGGGRGAGATLVGRRLLELIDVGACRACVRGRWREGGEQ